MREAGDPSKREERQSQDRERKSSRPLQHLPASNHPPEIDNELVAAPEPDLSPAVFRAFQTIAEAIPRMGSGTSFEALTIAAKSLGIDPPDLPQRGSLNPADIARSEYLFA